MIWVWLIFTIAFLLTEAFTYQMVCIWFAAGSIGGLVTGFLTDNYKIQIAVFVAVSAVMLICFRPAAKHVLKPKGLKTNIEDLVGKEVVITEDVRNLQSEGRGKVNGMEWTVRSADGSDIRQGSTAVIERIQGVKLIVKERNE